MKEDAKKNRKISMKERMGYLFDNIMSKGTVSLVAILFAITTIVVLIAGILMVLLDHQSDVSIGGGIWISLMHAIDGGTLAGDSGSLLFMVLMTLVTICGLFITSVLIGIINTGFENKMVSLSKGKSRVLVENHTVILGFNQNIFTMLSELIEANSNQKKGCIVVMDNNMTMVEMEDLIHQRIPDTRNTRILCRCGNITDLSDVQICAPEYARSIIINSSDDFITIKSILSVTTLLKQAGNTSAYLTAVIKNQENYEAARIAAENKAEILFFEDVIARIVSHASRQPGFSSIYTELFSFDGDEIYIEDIPGTEGLSMAQLNLYFPRATVIGIDRKDQVLLNPPVETKVLPGDRLILIAEDDGVSIPVSQPASADTSVILKGHPCTPEQPQKMLILGYGPRLEQILRVQDEYMAPGSQILLAVQEEYRQLMENTVLPEYTNIKVYLHYGDIYHKCRLSSFLDWEPDSILVCSSMQTDAEEDDNKTLLLLLQLRALGTERSADYTITSEMRKVENQEVAQITEVRDFVISSNITSLMVTQISQTRELNRIFSELLSSEGSEIYMRPAGDYVKLHTPVSMYTACTAAAARNQVFIGYRRVNRETGQYETITNPQKDRILEFREDDRFVVISED